MRRLILAASLLCSLICFAQRDNTFYVNQFPGSTLGQMTTAAQAACNADTSITCVIVFDPTVAKYPVGNMPAKCANCYWADYRTPSGPTGSFSLPTTASFQKLDNVRYCDQFTGATADVQINAAVADLPSNGGTIDCRGYGATTQTIAATVTIGSNSGSGKTVTMLVDRTTTFQCTITNNTPCVVRAAGSSIIGLGTVANPNAGFTLSSSAAVSNVLLTQDATGLGLVGGYVEGIMVSGHSGATVSDAILGVQNALQITDFAKVTVSSNGTNNTVGLKIYGTSGAVVGNIQLNNIQVDTILGTGNRPVWIGCTTSGSLTPVSCSILNTITFIGASALVHPGTGLPIVTIESQNGAGGQNSIGNIGFYGTQIESHSATDTGILIDGATSVHVYGLYATCNTACGADVVKIAAPTGTAIDGIDIRGVDNQGGWTNTLNNTITSSTFPFASFTRLNYAYTQTANRVENIIEGSELLLGKGSGISSDGGGYKHKRGGSCTTTATAGATCDTTLSWGNAFADTNYTVNCAVTGVTGQPRLLSIPTVSASSVVVRIEAATAAAASGNIHCQAVHD